MTVLHRLLALSLSLLLVGGNAAVCESLATTPEARMACCSEGTDCPMHHGESHGRGESLTQAQADACCTVSGRDQTKPSDQLSAAAISAPVLIGGVVVPTSVPHLVSSDRSVAPVPIAPVRRHVLLSVFLV